MQLQNIQTSNVDGIELWYALENDVWFNATKMVKKFNEKHGTQKRLDKFWELDETKEYIEILSDELKLSIPPSEGNREVVGFKRVINSFDARSGTCIHLFVLLTRTNIRPVVFALFYGIYICHRNVSLLVRSQKWL